MHTPAGLLRAWLGPPPWLHYQLTAVAAGHEPSLFIALGQAGRQLGRMPLLADPALANRARTGWDPSAWSVDQAARALLLLTLPMTGPLHWQSIIERCFRVATIEEQVSLYQALPLLPHPETLAARAAEGIRSSMAPVFAAVALDNPYPAERLDEPAFNQLVLKAFFNGCDIRRIYGLKYRLNPDLGYMLADYAHERRRASRPVDPALPPLARACGADCPDGTPCQTISC